jgi:hypothetical protein
MQYCPGSSNFSQVRRGSRRAICTSVNRGVLLVPFLLWGLVYQSRAAESLDAPEIVQRSVQNTNADWAAAPQFHYIERDVITKGGKRTEQTYRVFLIEGSPYHQLIAIDGQELSSSQAADQQRRLRQEINRRQKETPAQRTKRIAAYRNQRRQDHELMQQMAKAFRFQLTGQDMVNGRRCYVLQATPLAGYVPTSRDTKVLKGMRGTMWIDTEQYQWVKVHAEVFRPVAFGLFIAHVEPGTEFTLEHEPIEGNIWLPSHFTTRVRANVLFFSRRSTEDDTFTDYRRGGAATNAPSTAAISRVPSDLGRPSGQR